MEIRSHRDRLFAIAAGVLVCAITLGATSDLLNLIASLDHPAPTEVRASIGFLLANDVAFAIGACIASVAFIASPEKRQRNLGIASTFLGVALCLLLVSQLPFLLNDTSYPFLSHRRLASDALLVIYPLMQAIGAFIVAAGFFKATKRDDTYLRRRDRSLGWGAIYLAVSFSAFTASAILTLSLASESSYSGDLTTGSSVIAGSGLVFVIVWILVAVAFLSQRPFRLHKAVAVVVRRDGLLALACGLGAVALLGSSIGRLTITSASIYQGLPLTASYLGAGAIFVEMFAALVASAGFLVSRRGRFIPEESGR